MVDLFIICRVIIIIASEKLMLSSTSKFLQRIFCTNSNGGSLTFWECCLNTRDIKWIELGELSWKGIGDFYII